ncbi:antibiotic ABC transporter permease [Polaribacter sp. ALD11]|uniref:ABC transporter permease n=1 Tax=Polaribacter sp. ALD11 TaxID=2058137 RepID=UPI000C30BBAC|nr:ABC transporter permease [Polaribacter sp. ALD11]AUC83992.1 antibiotic ABC transporter permease [Polaribacter sp. ALD11]
MLKNWFKIFYRNSKKNWIHIVVNIFGLTVGFAGLLLVLLYLKDEQSYNANNANLNEIYRVIHKMSDGEIWANSTNVEGLKYKEDIPEITAFYLSNNWEESAVAKLEGKQVFIEDILEGNSNFFEFFPFEIIEGSSANFEKSRNHLAISEKQAKILFGNKIAIGKTIEFDGRSFIVTTVYKITGKHYFMPSMVIQFKKEPEGHWGNFSNNLFIKTTKEVNIESIEKKALAIWYQNEVLPSSKRDGITPEEFIEKYGTTPIFEPLKDIRLKTIADNSGPQGKGNYQLVLIMLSLSILLILISCVNFINLSIASATQRAKEVGVKKILGLSKSTLTMQYALEIIFQGFVSFLLSMLLVELILPSFNGFMNKEISILNFDLFLRVAIIAIIVSFIIGFIPAIYVSKFKTVEVLKGNVSRSKHGVFARNIMLGIQFLISGFFLTGSLIIYNQVDYMMKKELGFNGDQVVVVSMNEYKDRYKKYLLAKKELSKHPNIEVVTSNSYIIGGGSSNSTNVDYKNVTVQTYANAVDFDYLQTMKMKLLKGRFFDENRTSDTINNVIINETLAKAFNIYNDPIGKKIKPGFYDENGVLKVLNIIGMVKDNHTYGFDSKILPTMVTHWNTFNWMKQNFWWIQFKIKPNNTQETLKYIENYWGENIEQGYPFSAQFLNKRFARTYAKYQKQKTLFLILTSVVIIISLLGLFALATLTIQQRLKEVAIRKTLGASVKEIMFQLIKSFLKITIIASVILIPIAYYFMQNWLDNFVYRIDMPLFPFIITPIVLTILVFVVVGLKAFNATKIDLIKYLKFE